MYLIPPHLPRRWRGRWGGSYVWIYLVINHISTDIGSVVDFFKALKWYEKFNMVSPELPVSTVRRCYSFDCSGSAGRKVNGGAGSNFPPALPEYILPPAIVSFFTPASSSGRWISSSAKEPRDRGRRLHCAFTYFPLVVHLATDRLFA